MSKFLPLILVVLYAFLMMRFSVWRTRQVLERNSQPLTDPSITVHRNGDVMQALLDGPVTA